MTSDIKFVETTLQECTEAAERFAENDDNWHNHVLKPRCMLNPYPGKYVLVIENNSSGKLLAYVSDENPVETEQHIVKLRHGAGIIGCDDDQPSLRDEPAILARIRELVAADADWHHHMMLPDCVFNPRPGNWLITLESESGKEDVEHISTDEPIDVLRTIETLFFGQPR